MKPSPSRIDKLQEVQKANRLIRRYMDRNKIGEFVDVFTPMLTEDKKPRPELFRADSLHMTKQGYDLWQQTLEPYLK